MGLTYEEAVRELRADPAQAALVSAAYLDLDNHAASERFAASTEFAATLEHIRGCSAGGPLRLLDVGCGNGMAAVSFARWGAEVTALSPDLSREVGLGAAVRLRASAGPGSLRLAAAVAEALPFPAAVFDVVYGRQILHHTRSLDTAIRECVRVLRPGGCLLMVREHVVADDDELAAFLSSHPLHAATGDEYAYPVAEYERALRAAGLRVTTLGPFESPINAHPTTEDEIDGWLRDRLARRIGRFAASWLARRPAVRSWFRRRLSALCSTPGRNYSFVARKPQRPTTRAVRLASPA